MEVCGKENKALRQNLTDAGCDEGLTDRILCLLTRRQTSEVLALLAVYRKNVLEAWHTAQKRIDCLDYLVYRLQKETKESMRGDKCIWKN